MQPLITTADDRAAGAACQACGVTLRTNEQVAICGACGKPHHRHCWERTGACSAYECAPANRASGTGGAGLPPPLNSDFVITADQISAAAPLPSAPAYPRAAYVPPPASTEHLNKDGKPKLSRNALASIICSVAGIIFCGVPGAVGIVLGAIALGPIAARKRRGVWLAASGILLGLFDIVAWAVLIAIFWSGRSMPGLHTPDFHVSESALKDSPPIVAASMRANVLITRAGGMGSGVVIAVRDGSALILTNRHVASPDSTAEGAAVTVQYVDGQSERGKVVWNGPEGLDASLVRAPLGRAASIAGIDTPVTAHIGDDVFAVGNPFGLGWTLTKGTISQLRDRNDTTAVGVRIIQTSAPINPGNSGGGLYAAAGKLIGINTYAGSKRDSEGLGFAISVDSILTVLPQWALDDIKASAADRKKNEGDPQKETKDKPAP